MEGEYKMISRKELDDGLTVLTKNLPYTATATIGFWIKAGVIYEPEACTGMTHLLEHILGGQYFKGINIAEAIQELGGQIGGFTSKEFTYFYCKVPKDYVEECIEILASIFNPFSIENEDLVKEKEVVSKELLQYQNIPDIWVYTLLDKALWPVHPYGRFIGGDQSSLANISLDILQSYFQKRYSPSNSILIATGNVNKNEIFKKAESLWLDRKVSCPICFEPRYVSDVIETPLPYMENIRPTNKISNITIGFKTLNEGSYKRVIYEVLSTIVEKELKKLLRVQKGLCYSIKTSLQVLKEVFIFTVYATLQGKDIQEFISTVFEVFNRLSRGKIENRNFLSCIRGCKSKFLFRSEDTIGYASWLADAELYKDREYDILEFVKHFDKVVATNIIEASQELLTTPFSIGYIGEKSINEVISCVY